MNGRGHHGTGEPRRRNWRRGQHVASVLVLLLLPQNLPAQQAVRGQRGKAAAHSVVNFSELARRQALAPKQAPVRVEVPFLRTPRRTPPAPGAAAQPSAPALKAAPAPLVPSPSPAASFEAMSDGNTAITVIPPDTQGAVGPNHLMVTLNNGVRIQNRSGTEVSTVTLGTFWNSTGATGVFDPKLRYDPFAERWIFCAVSDRRSAASSVLMGVSETSDPTGTWFLYRVDADGSDVNWADYPTPGFNKDWIAVAVNMFAVADDAYAQSNIYVFSKADLYANGTGAHTLLSDPNGGSQAPAATYDNTLATLYLVEDLNGSSNGKGYLRISTVTGDVGSEVYSGGTVLPNVTSPWAEYPPSNGADFAPQLGSAQKIQNNDARILNAVYRNGSLWVAQNAFLPDTAPTHTAAQWWQLAPDGTVQQFGRVEDTNAALFYAFPTIAVNSQSDVLLGYSIFAADQYAAAGYSFRASGDATNTMRSSVTLKAGEAAYYKTLGGADNRWGDYSATVVDPVNDLDMWTIQEYAALGNAQGGPCAQSSCWGTWWGKIAVSPAAVKHRRGQLVSE